MSDTPKPKFKYEDIVRFKDPSRGEFYKDTKLMIRDFRTVPVYEWAKSETHYEYEYWYYTWSPVANSWVAKSSPVFEEDLELVK